MKRPTAKFDLESGKASLVSLTDLLSANLHIPIFQRPYDWRKKQIDDFIQDLQNSADTPLFLGLVVLHREKNGVYTIIDGQQRITSLLLLLGANGCRPTNLPKVRDDDHDFFRRLVTDSEFFNSSTPDTLSQRLLKNAYDRFTETTNEALNAAQNCTCIVYVAPMLAGATSLFERINLRGRDVSQFDLVKNRLIGWLTVLNKTQAQKSEQAITSAYDKLYRILNPKIDSNTQNAMEFDADRLLRVHWILFTRSSFTSSDRVIDAIDVERQNKVGSADKLTKYIQSYVDSLIDVARLWVNIQDPSRLPQETAPAIRSALNEFHRLGRLAELEPLIVAVMHRFGSSKDVADFIRLCTILSFRDGLAKRRGNRGRSPKWTMARAVYQRTIADATGTKIESTRDLGHHLFWKIGTWWNIEECKKMCPGDEVAPSECASSYLESSAFYQEFNKLLHYIFWEYGRILGARPLPKIYGSKHVQLNQFENDEYWMEFRGKWDIEHVFPRKPDQVGAKSKGFLLKLRNHEKAMHPWLHHIGNLTVVPRGENRGLLSNSDFHSKRDAMLERGEVRFNELFRDSKYIGNKVDGPFWGANNCKNRFEHLSQFATVRWGAGAIKALGVGGYDKRVAFESGPALDEEEGDDGE